MTKKEFRKFKKEFLELWREVVFERMQNLIVPRLEQMEKNIVKKLAS